MEKALAIIGSQKPLIHAATEANWEKMVELAKKYEAPLVVKGKGLDATADLVEKVAASYKELVVDLGTRELSQSLAEITQSRRLSIKKKFRPFGYPVIAFTASENPRDQVIEAAAYITKYASVVGPEGRREVPDPAPRRPEDEHLLGSPETQPGGAQGQRHRQCDRRLPGLHHLPHFALTYYTVEGEGLRQQDPLLHPGLPHGRHLGADRLGRWQVQRGQDHRVHQGLRYRRDRQAPEHRDSWPRGGHQGRPGGEVRLESPGGPPPKPPASMPSPRATSRRENRTLEKHLITFMPDNVSVAVREGTNLLAAAKQAGIDMSSPCGGRGTCGKCAVKVISGSYDSREDAHLSEDLKAQGLVLACKIKVRGPMTVEVPTQSRLTEHKVLLGSKRTRFTKENDLLCHPEDEPHLPSLLPPPGSPGSGGQPERLGPSSECPPEAARPEGCHHRHQLSPGPSGGCPLGELGHHGDRGHPPGGPQGPDGGAGPHDPPPPTDWPWTSAPPPSWWRCWIPPPVGSSTRPAPTTSSRSTART